jgi:hypothetical protein
MVADMNSSRVGKALAWFWIKGAEHVPVLAFWLAAFESLRQALTPVSGGGG